MESDSAAPTPSESERLARGARFAIVAIVLAVSVPSLYAALSIGKFMTLFGEWSLPILTQIVFSARPTFWFLGIVVPVGAIATLWMRQLVQSFYILGALVLVSTVQFIVIYLAITLPLMSIMRSLPHTPLQ